MMFFEDVCVFSSIRIMGFFKKGRNKMNIVEDVLYRRMDFWI